MGNSSCSFSTDSTCILSNLTLIHVVQGHYEGNYTLTAENDCGNATVYVMINIIGKFHSHFCAFLHEITFTIKVPPSCESDYNKPPELLTPPPRVVRAVQGENITIKAQYKGNIEDPNLLAYWCVATLDGNHLCILSTDNDTVYNM